jgi:hypothetical protein
MRLFIILFFSIVHVSALADCSAGGIYIYPSRNSEIRPNTLFVLEGIESSQKVLDSLNTAYPIYLVSGDERIQLNVVERCYGAKQIVQVILKPEGLLELNKTYTMKIDNLDDTQNRYFNHWNWQDNVLEENSWKVSRSLDRIIPQWKTVPKYAGGSFDQFGCGPVVYAHFQNQIIDSSMVYAETEVRQHGVEGSTRYFIRIHKKGDIEVGHGMCNGPFKHIPYKKYYVRFRLMDISGNKDYNWTSWIPYSSPHEG